jgi:serine/threonine protein kinase
LAEASKAAALEHRNIVQVYDVAREGSRHYLVVEYVEGRDLSVIVRTEGPLPFDVAANYVAQTASGLAHIHGHGMVHGGLRPAALLVDSRDVVKIRGMGVGRLSESTVLADEETTSAATSDTTGYLAPEQIHSQGSINHLADIFALGCVFYYLLAGEDPPSGRGDEPSGQDEPTSGVLSRRADTPRELVGICGKMMAREPSDRYQTADEVSRLLSKWLIKRAEAVEPPESRKTTVGSADRTTVRGPSAEAAQAGAADQPAPAGPDGSSADTGAGGASVFRRLAQKPLIPIVVAAAMVLTMLIMWLLVTVL